MEETGYTSEDWGIWFVENPMSKIEWCIYVFIAKNITKSGEQNLDSGEKIELEFVDYCISGDIDDVEIRLKIMKFRIDGRMNELGELFF